MPRKKDSTPSLNGHPSNNGLNGHAPALPRSGSAPTQWASAGSYRGASTTRLRKAGATPRSGDAHRDRSSRLKLGGGAEDLLRNHPLARAIVQRRIDLVVGDGFTLQVRTDDEAWNREVEERFNAWADNQQERGADVRGLLSLDEMAANAVWAGCVHGDIAFLKLDTGQLQAIEAPRIVNPGRVQDSTRFRGGVEVDEFGRPVALHASEWSESGQVITPGTRRIPWEFVCFYCNPQQVRSDATRGEPQLAASLQRYEDLDEYDLAVRAAARMAACFGLVIRSNTPGPLAGNLIGESVAGEGDVSGSTQREIEFAPGMVPMLRPGEDVTQINPSQPGAGYTDFVFSQVMMVGADLAMPLFLSMLDGRQVNLASMRALLQIVYRSFFREQRCLELRLYRPVYRFIVSRWIREGSLRLPTRKAGSELTGDPLRDWERHSWSPPPPPMMDAKAEIEAADAAFNARLKSKSRIAGELFGLDWNSEIRQIAAESKLMTEAGVAPVNKPGAATGDARGNAPPRSEDDA